MHEIEPKCKCVRQSGVLCDCCIHKTDPECTPVSLCSMHAIPDAGCSACSYPPTVTPNPEPPENDGEKGEDPNLHISIEEMEKDIVDTELEIEALRHDLASAEISRDRLGIMKAETGIKQREEFVEKLKKYLDIRKSK